MSIKFLIFFKFKCILLILKEENIYIYIVHKVHIVHSNTFSIRGITHLYRSKTY